MTAGDSSLTKLGVGNNRKTGSVEIKKTGVDDDATGLDGVTFALYRNGSQTAVKSGVTASGGSLSFTNLTWGDYYLVETGVPAGYQIDSTHHTFTISKDSLTKQFTNDSAINNTKTSFTLQKQNSDGIALNGATFKLEGLFAGEQQSSTITLLGSNENNVTLTGKLIVNEHYTLTETAAPDGYARMNTAIGFTMNADGTITLDEGTPACVSLTDGGKGIAVKDNPIQITIQKKDRDTQQSLSNCHFKLSGVFANTSETVFNGTDAQITAAIIGKLYSTSDEDIVTLQGGTTPTTAHIYTLEETQAPAGYQIETSEVKFVVNDQSQVVLLGNNGAIATASGIELGFTDPAINVKFVKTDMNGTVVPGAVLKISGVFVDQSTEKTITTEADAVELKAQLIADNEYTLEETSAPYGYIAMSGTATFKVDNQNQITLLDDVSGKVVLQNDGLTLAVKNEKKPASTCQELGYPSNYDWNASHQACIAVNTNTPGFEVPDTSSRN